MIFWLICLVMTLVVAAVVAAPLLRTLPAETDASELALYRAQIAEIDSDVSRDVLAADQAEIAKAEIGRRLIARQNAIPQTFANGASKPVAVAVGVVLIALSAGLYWQIGAFDYPDLPLKARIANSDAARENRPSQAQAEAAAPAPEPVDAPEEYLAVVDRLRALVPTRPDDLQGWVLLAGHEAGLRNFKAAAAAQARVVALKGADATVYDRMAQVDLMVAAADGFVSPESETIIRAVLAEDDANIAGRYYLGALYDQTDRPDIAFRLWREIVEQGNPAQFHVAFARDQIEGAAFRAGVDYALPAERGPTAADIANAGDMSTEDQQAMIANMVEGLADRLATQGGPVTDWARLITAYGVLGEQDTAREIWVEAQQVFGTSDDAMAVLKTAAQDAGLIE